MNLHQQKMTGIHVRGHIRNQGNYREVRKKKFYISKAIFTHMHTYTRTCNADSLNYAECYGLTEDRIGLQIKVNDVMQSHGLQWGSKHGVCVNHVFCLSACKVRILTKLVQTN